MINSSIYKNDLDIALNDIINPEILREKKILITGGTGLVGEPIVDLLIKLNSIVFVATRDIEKAKLKFQNSVNYIKYDATKEFDFDVDVDYVIHAASNATPKTMMKYPVETMAGNILGVYNLLNYSKLHKVKKFLFISSSEIYGKKDTLSPFFEDMYGYIDLLNSRSSYPMGKRAAETLCISYKTEYNIDVVIARLGHIYGPTASKNDNRVSSLFAYCAADGNDIIMKSDGAQIRSYMYCLDCASAILSVLANGSSGEAYNISNNKSIISIKQMAEKFSQIANVKLKFDTPSETEKKAFNPMNNSSINSEKLESLGWKSSFDVDVGFIHTIEIIKEKK